VAEKPITEGMAPLADLPGREEFDALVLREEMRRSRSGETITVAVLDIDGLGEIEARHGRDSAAELVLICAEALKRTLRAVDQMARTGYDEFSVLLHATDSKRTNAWADRFDAVLDQVSAQHPAPEVTCSLGVADTAEATTLVEAAARARRRMEVVQAVRKLRRLRESGEQQG
jgi:diguanylate cyclase (GGDEF)-like protein